MHGATEQQRIAIMFNVNLKSLIERMNPTLKESLDNAAGLCLNTGHYNIEIEHWLQKILEKNKHRCRKSD